MMFTFLKAQGNEIGSSLLDSESLDLVKRLINDHTDKFVLPIDCKVSDTFDFKTRVMGNVQVVTVDGISPDSQGLDIGPKTIDLFAEVCEDAKTIVWNGPMGVFEIEATALGTLAIAKVLAGVTDKGATTIIGGGDTASAVKKAGVAVKMSHVSTGGGASLEFLQGKDLPGVSALTDA